MITAVLFHIFISMKFRGKIFLWLFFLFTISKAQIYTFDHLGIENGMSQNQVNAITKDQSGFMWFGTWDGLNRYDGYSFKIFKHRAFDTTSLSSNFINHLLSDSKGRLWIGTNGGGLNLFLPKSETFLNLKFDPFRENTISNNAIKCIYEDSKGRIWVGSEFGLNLLQFEENNLYKPQISQFFFKQNVKSADINTVNTITQTGQNTFLVGSPDGLINLKLNENESFSYSIPELHTINQNEEISQRLAIDHLFTDSLDRVWAGTQSGLYLLSDIDSKTPLAKAIDITGQPDDRYSLAISFINQDKMGKLWIATLQGGLFVADDAQKLRFRRVRDENTRKIRQEIVRFTSLYQSPDENILWIGSDIDGVKKLTLTGRNFENTGFSSDSKGLINSAVFAVYVDDSKNKWIGTIKGISIIENSTGKIYNYPSSDGPFSELVDLKIRSFEEDDRGNIWIATVDGLRRLKLQGADIANLNKAEVKCYKTDESKDYGLPSNHIYDIHFDSRGKLWVSTLNGLSLYDPDKDYFKEVAYLPPNHYDRGAFEAKHIYEDRVGNLWISTNGGLHRVSFKRGSMEFGHYYHNPADTSGICSNEVNHVLQDSKGHYWIATAHGINRLTFEKGNAQFDYYSESEGLPNEYIYSIFEDERHMLWMSSNMGIIRYNPASGAFLSFVKEDGIQSNEFNIGAFHQAQDGKILFGGIAGLTEFYPEKIQENKHLPQVHITSVKSNGREILNFQRQKSDGIFEFGSDENNLSVEFVALDYTNPSKNRYAYKLANVNREWIDLGNQRSVTFSQLAPGKYTLMIRGSNNNGIWNEKTANLQFIIAPPFWQRPEFFSSLILILALGVYAFYRKRLRDQVKYVLELEKMQTALNDKVRRKAAADFHDEMGHYLTRINVLTEILKQRLKDASGEISGVVESIGEQSQKLYNGTRDFIWTINPENNSAYEVAIRLKDFGDDMMLDTDINFNVSDIDDELKSILLTTDFARHLVLIFKEGINNAVKHAGAKNIELIFSMAENAKLPVIRLIDDGVGIHKKNNSLGNGLQNMHRRAKKIDARIEIDSIEGRGTTISLIPLDNEIQKHKTA